MYLSNIRLENTGPIDLVSHEFANNSPNAPDPLILVGPNGSGKSIFLSHVVSAMVNAHGAVFDDTDVEKGKVYKLRSPSYIRRGQNYSLSCLEFSGDLYEHEVTLDRSKAKFEEELELTPWFRHWNNVPNNETTWYNSNFSQDAFATRDAIVGPHLYFPPNRFEDPAWLNQTNLLNKTDYFDAMGPRSVSNRPVIQYAPMKDNQSWLLDVIYDSHAVELKATPAQAISATELLYRVERAGPATGLLHAIERLLRVVLGIKGTIGWHVGGRSRRRISILVDGKEFVSNLFSLSTGQAVVCDLFLTILRHADLSGQSINGLGDVKGLVVVDEIDLHLHTSLQMEALPTLIQMFSGVQFIISTHSPLFLLGMEGLLGESNMTIMEMPSGNQISAERFSEFEAAFNHLSRTQRFESDLNMKLAQSTRPLLIVEGTTDIDYIRRAAVLLQREDVISGVEIVDGDGDSGLDKIWRNFKHERWDSAAQTVVLLYDCDVKGKNNEIGKAFQRGIPQQDSILMKGIENLFPTATIKRALEHKQAFVDHHSGITKVIRGEKIEEPEKWSVNTNEKGNLCKWLCENGDQNDFAKFGVVFDILEDCFQT